MRKHIFFARVRMNWHIIIVTVPGMLLRNMCQIIELHALHARDVWRSFVLYIAISIW
jgi:hypothetical protein